MAKHGLGAFTASFSGNEIETNGKTVNVHKEKEVSVDRTNDIDLERLACSARSSCDRIPHSTIKSAWFNAAVYPCSHQRSLCSALQRTISGGPYASVNRALVAAVAKTNYCKQKNVQCLLTITLAIRKTPFWPADETIFSLETRVLYTIDKIELIGLPPTSRKTVTTHLTLPPPHYRVLPPGELQSHCPSMLKAS